MHETRLTLSKFFVATDYSDSITFREMNKNRPESNPSEVPFDRQLRSRMIALGWNAAKTAVMVGVSQKTMHSWLHGVTSPPKASEIVTQESVFQILSELEKKIRAAKADANERIAAEKRREQAERLANKPRQMSPEEIAEDARRRAEGEAQVAARAAEQAEYERERAARSVPAPLTADERAIIDKAMADARARRLAAEQAQEGPEGPEGITVPSEGPEGSQGFA